MSRGVRALSRLVKRIRGKRLLQRAVHVRGLTGFVSALIS